ncbi:MAG: MTH938/NDUFAF3 family protein [Gammaproteobacteria bacterium]|nr:MTH938/NDUFAF3 family protein [Gammaproteobacteria bacterium]
MKISQEAVTDAVVIKSYGDGFLLIQSTDQPHQRITHNCILTPEGIFDALDLNRFDGNISDTQIEKIKSFKADVVILVKDDGLTSHSTNFTHVFAQYGISLEIMSLGAACRTYNLLLNEGRKPILLVNFKS